MISFLLYHTFSLLYGKGISISSGYRPLDDLSNLDAEIGVWRESSTISKSAIPFSTMPKFSIGSKPEKIHWKDDSNHTKKNLHCFLPAEVPFPLRMFRLSQTCIPLRYDSYDTF